MDVSRLRPHVRRGWSALFAAALVVALSAVVAAEPLVLLGTFPAAQAEQIQEFLDEYGRENGVEVELLNATSWVDLADKALTMSAGGIAPDVIMSDQLRMHQLRGSGIVRPLDAWIDRDGVDISAVPPGLLATMQFAGETYALPTHASLFNIYYNASRFEERGLDAVPSDWDTTGWSWDDFVAALQRLTYDTSGDGAPDHFGSSSFGHYGVNMIGLWGLHWVSEDRTRFVGTDPAVVEAMTRIWGLWTERNVIGGNFLGGTSGMFFSQTQYLATMAARGDELFDWSIGALPRGTTRAGNQVGVLGFYVASDSAQPEAAWQLVKYLGTSEAAGTRLYQITNRMPIQRESVANWALEWEERVPGLPIQSVIQGFDYAWDWWSINGSSAGDHLALMTEMGQAVQAGRLSPQVAIEQYAPRFQALLDGERQ